tara:strand:- start:513 stop:1103 length:591 start_codon:yes stop_codon:yes gene_type:complete
MTLMPEDVRNFLRELEIAYQDHPDNDKDSWSCGFFLPTENYRFDNRGGFGTAVTLANRSDEGYGYLRLLVSHLYDTENLSLENELLRKINNYNCKSKIVKWTLTKGKNESGAIDIRLHVEADIPAIGNVITSQFWNTHSYIYYAIEDTWAELDDIFSNNDQQIEAPKFSGAENMNLDKTELMEMFDSYLDEKFSNT